MQLLQTTSHLSFELILSYNDAKLTNSSISLEVFKKLWNEIKNELMDLRSKLTYFDFHLKSISSTSNTRVAFPGMMGGKPCCPYAYSGVQVSLTT